MPINLDTATKDLASLAASRPKVYSPKYFSDKLTGAGKKVGLLCAANNPVNLTQGSADAARIIQADKNRADFRANGATVKERPLELLPYRFFTDVTSVYGLDPDSPFTVKMATFDDCDMYMQILPNAVSIEETQSSSGTSRKFAVAYQIMLFSIYHANDPAFEFEMMNYAINQVGYSLTSSVKLNKAILVNPVCNVPSAVNSIMKSITVLKHNCSNPSAAAVYNDDVDKFIADYSLFDAVSWRSQQWQTSIAGVVSSAMPSLYDASAKMPRKASSLEITGNIVSRLSWYPVTLDQYIDVYKELEKYLDLHDLSFICKLNVNLMMVDTMRALDAEKPNLERVTWPANKPAYVPDPFYSGEQVAAITTDAPLSLVQSAAGTGKSTTIKGRLDYMQEAGIDPKDITVISFTNAAADHIKDIAPKVNSMTIASMIHTIYAHNFPTHQLSTESTLLNVLEIRCPQTSFNMSFATKLRNIIKEDDMSGLMNLNMFVENNLDKVIALLDQIQQTTLTLEIILCYNMIDTLVEPAELNTKHLIIDEVQDNSIFEFIYVLKYTAKKKNSLQVVGDASQTLYEFRASNPRALNTLEASQAFTAYRLQTNYRSNQEILDFANIMLGEIEANQYAKLQLQANNLAPVTSDKMLDHVRLTACRVSKLADIKLVFQTRFKDTVKPYIEECRKRNEQVCFLAFARKDVQLFEEMMQTHLPDMKCVNISSVRSIPDSVFSNFVKKYWRDVQFVPQSSIFDTIKNEIVNRLEFLCSRRQYDRLQNEIHGRIKDWGDTIAPSAQVWKGAVANGTMSFDDMLKKIQDSLIDYENTHNAIRQAIISQKNALKKQAEDIDNADVICSTIHSAKGLEFDNTIVLYRAEDSNDEAAKRMYYVAATRAKNTELVLAFTRQLATPLIIEAYDAAVASLLQAEGKPVPDDLAELHATLQ